MTPPEQRPTSESAFLLGQVPSEDPVTPPEPRPLTGCQVWVWDGPYKMRCGRTVVNGECGLHGATPAAEAGPGLRAAVERFFALHDGRPDSEGWCNGKCSPVAAMRAALEPRS